MFGFNKDFLAFTSPSLTLYTKLLELTVLVSILNPGGVGYGKIGTWQHQNTAQDYSIIKPSATAGVDIKVDKSTTNIGDGGQKPRQSFTKDSALLRLANGGGFSMPRPSILPSTFNLSQDFLDKIKQVNDEREKARMAAIEAARQAQIEETPVIASQPNPVPVQPVYTPPGDCTSWLTQVNDPSSASVLINRESGCNPYIVNPSSGSCGVAQELPCGKSGCQLGDGACQVRWMEQYVMSSYGSWATALAHSYSYNWY